MTVKNKKIFIILCFWLFVLVILSFFSNINVKADDLSDTIKEQLGNLDYTNLENFFNSLNVQGGTSFNSFINLLLEGKYNLDFNSIIGYVLNIFLSDVKNVLPTFLSIIAISIFCAIIKQIKNSFLSDSVAEICFYVCFSAIVALLLVQLIDMFQNTKNIIKNIANLTEIMSPIILTLMIAVGGNVSATVYKPTVAFLSGGIVNIILYVVLPLTALMTVFSVSTNLSQEIKLNKFSDLSSSIIKWVFGIIVCIFTSFLSVQGITSASFDGVSIKAAKYAISNSIPIVGGFLKEGFDLIVAGSVLIKQTIGLACVFALFYLIISPVLYMTAFSLLLKFVAAITETISDIRISNFCLLLSKTITYLIVSLLVVALMFFISTLLMIFSANAFI